MNAPSNTHSPALSLNSSPCCILSLLSRFDTGDLKANVALSFRFNSASQEIAELSSDSRLREAHW